MQNPSLRHYALPHPEQALAELGPGASPLDQIETRLRQLEHEESARMAARSHLLALRKREDEEFRKVTETAEAEEEVRRVLLGDLTISPI